MKTDVGRKRFCVSEANVYNNVPILARQLDSRVLFRAHLDGLHSFIRVFT